MFLRQSFLKVAASLALSMVSASALAETFTLKVTAQGFKYLIDGDLTPDVNVEVGDTVIFDLSDASLSSHPFYVTERADSRAVFRGAVSDTSKKQVVLTITESTPKNLFYSCTRHSRMGGAIKVQN